MTEIVDPFTSGALSYWSRFSTGQARLEEKDDSILFSVDGAPAGSLSDAEINDHQGRRFPWSPPLAMEVRARFSHPSGELLGTSGFGFWNAPVDTQGNLLAPPNWLWFFYASPPSSVSLSPEQPGWGWKAAMLNTGRAGGSLLPLVDLVSRLPVANRLMLLLARRSLKMGDRVLTADMTQWHTYRLHWLSREAIFEVDEAEVYRVHKPPNLALGFIAWMDNQCASMTPESGLSVGQMVVSGRQWMELDLVAIKPVT